MVKGRAALALGDPIGPGEDAVKAIVAFQRLCAENDWLTVFYQTLPDYVQDYCRVGLTVTPIGQEAIVDLGGFTLAGGARKDLRNTVNRFGKHGFLARLCEAPIPDRLLDQLRTVSDLWLATMHGKEKGFSLGWFEDEHMKDTPVMAVHRPDGAVTAFADTLPEYQLNEATIDLMRHVPDAENGTLDFLFVSLCQWARKTGHDTFNLGLSSLSGVGERPEDPTIERALHYVCEHVGGLYNSTGLHAYKDKFVPIWSPRYLVFPGQAALLAVAVALVRADSGDHFAWDYVRDWHERRRIRSLTLVASSEHRP